MRPETADSRRWRLDELVARVLEPGFVSLFCRLRTFREASGHVSPSILALQSPRSGYVSRWRRHARRCPVCGSTYRYYGFTL